MIEASEYNDPLLHSIRQTVSQKDDGTPFLLMPVKLETRFMKAERPVEDDNDKYPWVINDLFDLEELMLFDPYRIPEHEAVGKMRRLRDKIGNFPEDIDGIIRLSAREKNNLKNHLNQLEGSYQRLSKSLSRKEWKDPAKAQEVQAIKNTINGHFKTLDRKIGALEVTGTSEYRESEMFIGLLNGINEELSAAKEKDLGSRDRDKKRELFAFLDQKYESIDTAVKKGKTWVHVNMPATTKHLKKIDEVRASIPALQKAVLKNITNLRSEYKKTEFTEKFNLLFEKISGVYVEVDQRLKPKVQLKLDLQTSKARDILWQVNTIRRKLKQQNKYPFGTYDEVRNRRVALYDDLHALRDDIHKVVEGTAKEKQAISEAWDDTDAELVRFTQRVDAFESDDRYEKAGLTRTITHINEEYRKDLAGMKSGSKSYFTELNNKNLEKSALTYRESLEELQSIEKELDANQSDPSKLKGSLDKLVAFRDKFSGKSRDIQVLPTKDYNELNALSDRVKSKAESITLSGSFDNQYKKIVSESAQGVKAFAEAQFIDTIDRKDRFYDEKRNPYVYARQTRTVDELWIRIYPDDLAIHSHEKYLTEQEVEGAKAYWHEIWAAGDDYEAKLAAWRAVATAFGSQRAAYIVKVMKPTPVETSDVIEDISPSSRLITEVNQNLKEIVTRIQKETKDPLKVLGETYPLLHETENMIKNARKEPELLLKKTERWVIKLQSLLSVIAKEVRNSGANGRISVLNQFGYSFNRIARYLGRIERIPAKDIDEDEGPGEFPDPPVKSSSWTETPHSKVMPDRFVAITRRNGQYKHIKVGKKVPENLTVGLNPGTFQEGGFEYDEDGNLIVEESIKWLTDFEEARDKGMAIALEIDEDDLTDGFDQVLVIGVKDTTEEEGKTLIEQLIDNHHYLPEGASFIPIGTPTNNSDGKSSGYQSDEDDAELSFKVERNNEETPEAEDPDHPSDASRLAKGLGIEPDYLDNLNHHDHTGISDALNMNRALFPGTLGNYMEEALDQLFTLDNIDRTRAFMSDYVSGRGYLPSLRIGTQPYGILPTTAFRKLQMTANDENIPELNKEDFNHPGTIENELQARYGIRLKQMLNSLDGLWTYFRGQSVPHSGNTDSDNPQQHFMQMLGLQANTSEIYYRYGVNIASRQSVDEFGAFSINFDSTDEWSPTNVGLAFRHLVLDGYFYNSDNFKDEQKEFGSEIEYQDVKNSRVMDQFKKARIFVNRFIEDQAELIGDQVDTRELLEEWVEASTITGSPEERLKAKGELQNYIDWITGQNPWDVHAHNKFAEVADGSLSDGMPSKSLMFLLLRHSILSAYADTMLKILDFEGLVDQKVRKKMGQPSHFYNRYAGGLNYITKWSYLFSPIERLNGALYNEMDTSNSFYIYMKSLTGPSRYLNRYVSPESTHVFNNYSLHNQHQPFMHELDQTRKAIEKIKDFPTAQADQLMKEHLDLCTYRLDAWRLGLVNKRLEKQRNDRSEGIFIGAFGWLEHLEKGDDRDPAPSVPEGLWKEGDEPVYTDDDNLGYIHTPSINHAITSAILRAGYHANESKDEVNNQMAVNLSSGRVRKALTLLNGILQGQDAAAILGYQFERGLHENHLHAGLELDQYIYDFRKAFPLQVPVETTASPEEVAQNNVVNGIELLEAAQQFIEDNEIEHDSGDNLYQILKSRESDWWNEVDEDNIKSASAAKRDAMLKEIDRIADTFDAFGDLCISESVYQVAQGNHVRASAIMDKLAKGDVPNEIQITETPRTGTVLTQKVGTFVEPVRGVDHALTPENPDPVSGTDLEDAVSTAGAAPAGWGASFSPRALAEPTLNKWIGELIGNPAHLKCLVKYSFDETKTTTTVTLADLDLQPLDVLHLFGTGPLDGGAELNARIAEKVKQNASLPPGFEGSVDDLTIHIQYTQRGDDWSEDDYSFYEKAAYIQGLRRLLTDSAVISADTLLISGQEEVEEDAVRNQDLEEYLVRITNLKARMVLLKADWEDFFNNTVSVEDAGSHTFTDLQIDTLRDLLARSSTFGIPGTVPETIASYGDAIGVELLNSGDGAYKAITDRLKQAEKELAVAEESSHSRNSRVLAVTDAGKALLGKAFVMIPHFNARRTSELTEQLGLAKEDGLLREAGMLPFEDWMQGVSKVRERVNSLQNMEMWGENFDADLPGKSVIQFPFELNEEGKSKDHWLGIEFPNGYTPENEMMAMVISNSDALSQDIEEPKAGLLIDEWVEIIPNKQETTGVAFNYDQPNAKPPNNVLLSVTPKETGSWDWDDLVHTLEDTLELSKNRAVEPEHLEETVLGQVLPGILTEIVPPQLRLEDEDEPQDNPLGHQVVTDFGVVNETYEEEEE